MRKAVNHNEPYGAQELIIVIENENGIEVVRHTETSSVDYLYPIVRRKGDIIYLTKLLALNTIDNTVFSNSYHEEGYLSDFASTSDKHRYVIEIINREKLLQPYISDINASLSIKMLLEYENNIYTVYSSGIYTIFIVYNSFTEEITYAQLIESSKYNFYDCKPKIQINGKFTDPF